MNKSQVLDYYSREDRAAAILAAAQGREAVGAFWSGAFDARPNILQYSSDIVQLVRKGVTSFHISVERWKNAMALSTGAKNYAKWRSGFDIVIDIDSKLGIEESQLAALRICQLLGRYGIKNYGLKFSGRRGFHIALAYEALPKEIDYKPTRRHYPRLPKIIARFIRKSISTELMKDLVQREEVKKLMDVLDEQPQSPYYFVEIEKDWGARHLFRAPYSLNEKTWLVSLPLTRAQLANFSPDMAQPQNVRADEPFFRSEENEAEALVLDALDWWASVKKEKPKKVHRQLVRFEQKIPEDLFPPCIRLVLNGLQDGKKRSIFTLINFLRLANWSNEEIEARILEWNAKNQPPLPRSTVVAQLRYHQAHRHTTANCDNSSFYSSIGICQPDETCTRGGDGKITVKNPLNYPFRKMQSRKRERFAGYRCSVCNESFARMVNLNRHRSRTHGIYEDMSVR